MQSTGFFINSRFNQIRFAFELHVPHFAPKKVKREDIVFAVTVQSGKYEGLSKEMEAPDDEARKAVYNWTSRNM